MITWLESFTILDGTNHGRMSEWSNVHAWKACVLRGTAGSNPVPSANQTKRKVLLAFLFFTWIKLAVILQNTIYLKSNGKIKRFKASKNKKSKT